MIITTQPLKDSILASEPQADQTILQELCDLVRKYQLNWVTAAEDKGGAGAYFVMSEVAKAKGLDEKDYVKHWGSLTSSEKGNQSESLAGRDFKLVGDSLKSFKDVYFSLYGESLGRAPSLLIGDWKRTYSYLTQGRSETAKDFQSLGSRAIEVASTNDLQHTIEPDLQKQLIELSSYSNINFRFEVATLDSFNPGSHRRWDFVERLPKVVKVHELKARTLSEQDVKSTLIDKKYIELAIEKYSNKSIEFIFTSPKGISWEAKNYIQEVNDKAKKLYPGSKVKVSFIDLQDITERVISNILDNSPIESHFWLKRKLELEFTASVSQRTIAKLNSSIVEAYRNGRLIKKAKPDNVIQFPILKSAKAA
nr:hypothetical protein [Nostoc sp. ChiQUE02]MDZ8232481.1 hypothetical protein [Nostoc sp. ChiQUE02]